MIDDTIKKNQDQDVVDVDLGFVEKRKFRICGDYNRILELNVSDLNIMARLKTSYPKLKELLIESQNKIQSIPNTPENNEQMLENIADCLTEIDGKMREIIDYIFDTNASAVCAPSGNMFDPVDGQYRFERIIDKLMGLYSIGLDEEYRKIKNTIDNKTKKYTKKSKK